MSTYLATYLDLIPLGYTIVQMQNTLVGNLTANGWQLLAQVDGVSSDLIPPATETIGTSTFREVVRIYFPNNTTIVVGSYQACIADAFPQSFMLTAATAGAVQASVTVNGVTVLGALGTSSSTANDNLRTLYYALRDSADPTIQGWDWEYNGSDTLVATCKTPAANTVVSAANVTYSALASSVLAGARSGFANNDNNYGYSVTTDLTNGFVYYLAIFSRSFVLGTKCLSGVTGPVFASYVDHAAALEALPNPALCTPVELLIGNLPTMRARVTHFWAGMTAYSNQSVQDVEYSAPLSTNYYRKGDWHPFTGAGFKGVFSDVGLNHWSSTGASLYSSEIGLAEMGIAGTGSVYDGVFKAIPVAMGNYLNGEMAGYQYSVQFLPPANLPDIAVWGGSEPLESCAWCREHQTWGTPTPMTLQMAMDDATAYPTVALSSTAGLSPTGGMLQVGGEYLTYTGETTDSATGCSRGANGSAMQRHFVGDDVFPGNWYVKVNNGALFCGPQQPV